MDQRPYPVEPISAATVVGRSFSTYFRNLGSFAVFVFIINGILMLANFISSELYSAQGVTLNVEEMIELFRSGSEDINRYLAELRSSAPAPSTLGILIFSASLFLVPLINGGIAYVATGYFLGKKRTPVEWLRLACSKYKSLFVTHICTILLLLGVGLALGVVLSLVMAVFLFVSIYVNSFIGVLLMIAALIVFVIVLLFFVAAQSISSAVVVRENISGFRPFRRSIELCYSRFWKSIGLAILASFVMSLCEFALSFFVGLVLDIFGADNTVLSRLFDSVLIALLFNPLVPIAFNLHYISLRIEKEGSQALTLSQTVV